MRVAHFPVFQNTGEETFYFLLFYFQYYHGSALLKSSYLAVDFFSIFFLPTLFQKQEVFVKY
jgi:hypothetical protein